MKEELKEKIRWEVEIFLLFVVGFSVIIIFGVYLLIGDIDYTISYVIPFTFVFILLSYVLGSIFAFIVKRIAKWFNVKVRFF